MQLLNNAIWKPSISLIYLFCIANLPRVEPQDVECTSPAMCNQIVLNHSVQIKTHCVYLNILFRNMSEETLAVGIFRLCRRTLILDMSNNKIKFIKAGAFLGLGALQQLYLANNQIERIEPGTFHTLTSLEVFALTGNKLKTIPEYEFTSKTLRFFNINNNDIRKLPDTALLNLRDAELIDLSLNRLDTINPHALGNVKPGVKIILNNNELNNITMVFNVTLKSKLYSVLEASGNVIKALSNNTLGDFYKLRISVLDLSLNFISDIEIDTFDNYRTLQTLYLAHNRIRSVHSELFKSLTNLSSLDLSHNLLTQQVFRLKLPDNLVTLNYSHNRIENYVDYHWSQKMKRRYVSLDISNNSISYLDPNRFCRYITSVNLAYNDWRCDVLYGIVRNLEMRGINVVGGVEFIGPNVNGISCSNGQSKILDEKLEDMKKVLNKEDKVHTEEQVPNDGDQSEVKNGEKSGDEILPPQAPMIDYSSEVELSADQIAALYSDGGLQMYAGDLLNNCCMMVLIQLIQRRFV